MAEGEHKTRAAVVDDESARLAKLQRRRAVVFSEGEEADLKEKEAKDVVAKQVSASAVAEAKKEAAKAAKLKAAAATKVVHLDEKISSISKRIEVATTKANRAAAEVQVASKRDADKAEVAKKAAAKVEEMQSAASSFRTPPPPSSASSSKAAAVALGESLKPSDIEPVATKPAAVKRVSAKADKGVKSGGARAHMVPKDALGKPPTFEPASRRSKRSSSAPAQKRGAKLTVARVSASRAAATLEAGGATYFSHGTGFQIRGTPQVTLGRLAARAHAEEAAFRAERAEDAARRARFERLAVERAVKRKSVEAQAALLRTGAEHAARAALQDAKVSAAKEAVVRTTAGLRAAEAVQHELEGSVGAQKRCVKAEWGAAEAASTAHAIATERAAATGQQAAQARGNAERAKEQARRRNEEAITAARHAEELESAAAFAHEKADAQVQPTADAEHAAAMGVLAARRAATAQAKATVDEAGREYVAASAKATAVAKALAASERALVATAERPMHWFATSWSSSQQPYGATAAAAAGISRTRWPGTVGYV